MSNVSAEDLLGNELITEAVLDFLKDTRVEIIKDGILDKG